MISGTARNNRSKVLCGFHLPSEPAVVPGETRGVVFYGDHPQRLARFNRLLTEEVTPEGVSGFKYAVVRANRMAVGGRSGNSAERGVLILSADELAGADKQTAEKRKRELSLKHRCEIKVVTAARMCPTILAAVKEFEAWALA